LITGIAGLIGSRFAAWLKKNVRDVEIIGIDDLSCGYRENIPQGIQTYRITLGTGDWKLARIFDTMSPDYVFHFAAYAAEGLSPFIRCYNYRSNLLATAELINQAIESGTVKRFVFTSSMAVYGANTPPFHETMETGPIDPYGVAKAAAERDLQIAGEQHGLDWTILRPHNVYGPGQSLWQDYRNVLGIWMARHLDGQPLRIYGDGSQQRAFSFISDCLPAIWQAATKPQASKQIINLGGTKPVSIAEAAELCREVMGGGELVHVEPRHEVSQAWCTWRKSVDLLGYSDETPLREGLREMWTWARWAWDEFPDRRGTSSSIRLEIERGLYSFWQRKPTQHPKGF
jgi:UDP-glucose 4-epimerase